jgi:cytoskeletal protein CcmA (bactofilin family)
MLKRFALLGFLAAFATGACAASFGTTGIFAGGDTDITTPVDGNLYVAGGQITVDTTVSGKARIAGGHIEIAPGAKLANGLSAAGGRIVVRGNVSGDMRVAGGHVTLDGPVSGDATVAAGTLDLGPNARIDGKLIYRGESIDRDPAAIVAGGVVQRAARNHSWDGGMARSITGAVWTLGLMLLAAIIAGALPGPTRRMQEELRTRPWLASLLGIVALICIPVAAVLVMITIIGIPIGLLAILGYVALIVVGYVSTAVVVSGLLLDRYKSDVAARTAWRVGAAVLAMLVVSSLAHMPLVGKFVGLVALVVGVGVIVGATLHRKQPVAAAA